MKRHLHAAMCFGAALFDDAASLDESLVRQINDGVDSLENMPRRGLEELEVLVAKVYEVLEVSVAGLQKVLATANFVGNATIVYG